MGPRALPAEQALKQFELWWADLPAPIGRRPVLILSRSSAVGYLRKLTVAEITTRSRGIPQELRLGSAEGLPQPSVANLDSIQSVPKSVLTARIGALSGARQREVKCAVGHAFDWVELKLLS